MTSNDVRDILSLPDRSRSVAAGPSRPQTKSSKPPQHGQQKPKPKYDGITRELFALLGDNAPSLAMAQGLGLGVGADGKAKAGFRPKFKKRPGKARRWAWTPFQNPAREDTGEEGSSNGLILHHWAPAKPQSLTTTTNSEEESGNGKEREVEVEKDYKFAQFNTSSGVYSYSNDEYIQHLRDDDWTKEETDYLIDLCHQYDLRFVVITDRYEWPGKERTMEDLKARYYAICRRLIRSRISTEDMETRQALLVTYAFDKQREVERKKAVTKLFTRTPAQLAEEEALYVELRRLEQNEAKFASEREELLRLLGGWESLPDATPQSVAAAGAGLAGSLQSEESQESKRPQKKRKTEEDGAEGIATSATSSAKGSTSGPLTSKQRAELKQAQFDEAQCIVRFDPEAVAPSKPPYPHLVGTPSTSPPVAPSPSNPASAHGVYLRSTRMLAPRPNLAPRALQTLSELVPTVGPKLVFPTARNAEKWEGLMGAVTSGLEMKRQLDRVESELRIAKSRLASMLGQQQPQRQQSFGPTTSLPAASVREDSVGGASASTPVAAPPSSAGGSVPP
ncbi:hypothetical protein IE53DRAFT_387451 [Violaceomyces palustris]|uniref:Uncharacterized protein n=1 Tax=Violaceomyces palustris TaxID=1673888 RepID=A0ACD0NWT3_9BASI|nr:hypothetical protein IE53DRAFT_387451 [Violaceomyces palustris]